MVKFLDYSDGPDTSGTKFITSDTLNFLYRPGTSQDAPHAALVMLHGFGANEGDIYELVQFVDKSVVIAAPRAPHIADDAPRGSFKWYDRLKQGQPEPGLFEESLDRLTRFIEELPNLVQQPLRPDQIYVGGFSQGAVMSYAVALTRPDLVAGVAAHSGFLPPNMPVEPDKVAGRQFFIAHGMGDQVLSVSFGREANRTLKDAGAVTEYHEYDIEHWTSQESRQDLANWLQRQMASA